MIIASFTNEESFSCSQWYLYSSVRKFVIEGTDENGENWYMTNNNQFTVAFCSLQAPGDKAPALPPIAP